MLGLFPGSNPRQNPLCWSVGSCLSCWSLVTGQPGDPSAVLDYDSCRSSLDAKPLHADDAAAAQK